MITTETNNDSQQTESTLTGSRKKVLFLDEARKLHLFLKKDSLTVNKMFTHNNTKVTMRKEKKNTDFLGLFTHNISVYNCVVF